MHLKHSKVSTIDEYIALFPEKTQQLLQELRIFIQNITPESTQSISYAIPTFKLNGRNLVHFAAYETHIGFYPGPITIAEFKSELAVFKSAKGSVQFPLDQPIPFDLIKKMVLFAVRQSSKKSPKKDLKLST